MQKTALFFNVRNSFGGAERRLIRAFGQLYRGDEQHEVIIIILETGTTAESEKLIIDWTSGGNKVVFLRSLKDVITYIAENRFTWICAAAPNYTTLLLFIAAKLMGTKTMFFSVESSLSRLLFSDKKCKTRFMLCCKAATAIDVLYPQAAEIMKNRFKRKAVTLTPGAFVDYEKFAPQKKENLIVFSARLIKGKNAELFIESLVLIKEPLREKGYICCICGEGSQKETLTKDVKDAGLDDIVRFTGYIDTAELLGKAKVFCSLQAVTNYPSQSLIEALASGCVCVVTDTGESYLMLGNDCGFLTEESAESVAGGIRSAVDLSTEAFDKKSAAARSFAVSNFSLEKTLEHFKKILY